MSIGADLAQFLHERVKDFVFFPAAYKTTATLALFRELMAKIDTFLKNAFKIKASDLHIATGNPPMYRRYGKLKEFKFRKLTRKVCEALIYEILSPEQRERFEKNYELDFCYEIEDVARFRGNVLYQRTGIDASFRTIPFDIPSIDELGLPPVVKDILDHHQGLILVTGAAGHGKSTTLAAMVDQINKDRAHHVLTVEDPIEFVHPIKKGVVNQREIGRHTLSNANALKGALREDPDVIMIGELRDRETTSLAMTAAETGHLVLGTMSTSSAHKTVDRIIDSYPAGEQNQVRTMLADSLKAVITQRLIRNVEENGMVLATEVLIGTVPMSSLIRDRKTFQIPSMIQTGKAAQMRLMDESIVELIEVKKISLNSALKNIERKKHLQRFMSAKETATAN
jgi:twitching motility protein PilT